jgi:TonB family protein
MTGIVRIAFLLAALLPAAAFAGAPQQRARSSASLATLFSDADYPESAVRNQEQGSVAFRLRVGADGRPAGCSVTGSSGSTILDTTTCALLMERARFEPARDGRGRATTDELNGRIVWRLPDDSPRLDAAQKLWSGCALGEAAKLIPHDLAAEEVARRSFPPCAALEALVAREVGEPAPLEAPRASMRRVIEEWVAETRTALAAPPQADPKD